MPALTLPTLTQAEISSHNSKTSCYVTIGNKVYNVTPFLADHPGGDQLIIDYAGKDITEILKDEISHSHSESAYEILDDYLVGYLQEDGADEKSAPEKAKPSTPLLEKGVDPPIGAVPYIKTGLATAEDLSKDTDYSLDYKKHKFIDLSKPMFGQVWYSGWSKEFYLDQVHRPRHYKGGASAPLFGNFLEPLSKTPWYVVPMVWLPLIAYGIFIAYQDHQSAPLAVLCTMIGVSVWTLIEYTMHRFLFHVDERMPDNRVCITLHFILHGIHHYLPMDRYRLVMPPTLFLALATPFWYAVHALFDPFVGWHIAVNLFCGGILGYVGYDLTHYFLHHRNLPAYWRELKKYHLQHHFADYQLGFGVSSKLWDKVFGTELIYGPGKST